MTDKMWFMCIDFSEGQCSDDHCPWWHCTHMTQKAFRDDNNKFVVFFLVPLRTQSRYLEYTKGYPLKSMHRCYGGMGIFADGASMIKTDFVQLPPGDTDGYSLEVAFDRPKHHRHASAILKDVGNVLDVMMHRDPSIQFVVGKVQCQILGNNRQVMAELKYYVQLKIDGFAACDDNGKPMWHWSLAHKKWRAPRMEFGFAEVDKEAEIVRMFGPSDSIEFLVAELASEIGRREEFYRIPAWMQAIELGIDDEDDSEDDDEGDDDNSSSDTEEPDCPVCMMPVDDDKVVPPCGHAICRSCLQFQCTASDKLPLRCSVLGCESPDIPLSTLESVLTFTEKENLLQNSASQWARTTEGLFLCPTPECGGVIHEQDAKGIARCTDCLHLICFDCRAIYHKGKTCEEFKESHRAEEEELRKFKAENGIKDCPRCGSPYDKIEGCDHIKCHGCGAHFCHVCSVVFRTEHLVYNHMNEAHRGWLQALEQEQQAARERQQAQEPGRQEEEQEGHRDERRWIGEDAQEREPEW